MEAHSLPHGGGLPLPRSPRLLAGFSDDRLVGQVRRGNDAAFEAIFDRHHRAILSFCRHLLGSADEAEDAVQQTFVSAYDAMRSDSRELKLKAWLYAIARNKCLSMLRARRETPGELGDVPTVGLGEEVQQRADLRELLRDMRELPEQQRSALVLAELGDLSHTDIGAIVGCDPVKVKALVYQARSTLIESRNARETPCAEIREQLATARGGVLRRGPLRKHLKTCEGCRQFRDDVMRQRAMVALVLPVMPSLGLKASALGAAGGLSGGAGLAAGGSAATGLGAGTVASAGGVKLAAAVLATVAAVGGGGVAVSEVARDATPRATSAAPAGPDGRPLTGPPRPNPAAVLPGIPGVDRGEARSEQQQERRKKRQAERREAIAERRAERERVKAERKAAREQKTRTRDGRPDRPARTRPDRTKPPKETKRREPRPPETLVPEIDTAPTDPATDTTETPLEERGTPRSPRTPLDE